MKFKKFLYTLLSLMYMDLIFNFFMYDSYLKTSLINIFLFSVINAFLIFLLTNMFNKKVNKVMSYIIYIFLALWYSIYYVFYQVLLTPFSVALLRQTDQVLKFSKNILLAIVSNIHVVLLFFVPVILLIIFKKKINFDKIKLKYIGMYIDLFVLSIGGYVVNIFLQDRGIGSIYNLYFENNNVSLNIERLGVPAASYIDIYRLIFGFEEKIEKVKPPVVDESDEIFDYEYNKNNKLDFSGGNGQIATINEY